MKSTSRLLLASVTVMFAATTFAARPGDVLKDTGKLPDVQKDVGSGKKTTDQRVDDARKLEQSRAKIAPAPAKNPGIPSPGGVGVPQGAMGGINTKSKAATSESSFASASKNESKKVPAPAPAKFKSVDVSKETALQRVTSTLHDKNTGFEKAVASIASTKGLSNTAKAAVEKLSARAKAQDELRAALDSGDTAKLAAIFKASMKKADQKFDADLSLLKEDEKAGIVNLMSRQATEEGDAIARDLRNAIAKENAEVFKDITPGRQWAGKTVDENGLSSDDRIVLDYALAAMDGTKVDNKEDADRVSQAKQATIYGFQKAAANGRPFDEATKALIKEGFDIIRGAKAKLEEAAKSNKHTGKDTEAGRAQADALRALDPAMHLVFAQAIKTGDVTAIKTAVASLRSLDADSEVSLEKLMDTRMRAENALKKELGREPTEEELFNRYAAEIAKNLGGVDIEIVKQKLRELIKNGCLGA